MVYFQKFRKRVKANGKNLNNELKVRFKFQGVYYFLASISQTLLMHHQQTPFKEKIFSLT